MFWIWIGIGQYDKTYIGFLSVSADKKIPFIRLYRYRLIWKKAYRSTAVEQYENVHDSCEIPGYYYQSIWLLIWRISERYCNAVNHYFLIYVLSINIYILVWHLQRQISCWPTTPTNLPCLFEQFYLCIKIYLEHIIYLEQ